MGLPKIMLFGLVLVMGWLLYRTFVEDAKKLTRKNEEKRKESATGAIGTLVKDPVTGEYRLKTEQDD